MGRGKGEVRASDYRDEEKDMVEEGNCNNPLILQLNSQATPLHSLCIAQDKTPLIHHVCCTCAPAEAKGVFSNCSVLGDPQSSSVYFCLHAHVKGHCLWQHLLQQVLVTDHQSLCSTIRYREAVIQSSFPIQTCLPTFINLSTMYITPTTTPDTWLASPASSAS